MEILFLGAPGSSRINQCIAALLNITTIPINLFFFFLVHLKLGLGLSCPLENSSCEIKEKV